jgi:hypothetical protein
MNTKPSVATVTIECPLCLGAGELTRAEILDRLGVKDFARVAQLSTEEAFRLLLQKQEHAVQNDWARFEAELLKRTADIAEHHKDELHSLTARNKELEAAARVAEHQKTNEIQHLNRRVEDSLREVAKLQELNHELESELSKVARIGKREEMNFTEEARTWPGICVGEKLSKNGDFILAYRDPSGVSREPRMLLDNKDKACVVESDLEKLVRDAKERSLSVAVLVTREESQLRQIDKEDRWGCKDGIESDRQLLETEREAVIVARRGQGLFKQRVMQVENRCRITGVTNPVHLRASHCKPWRDSSNDERINGENGLLLTPTVDHLFDRGFISFEDSGVVIISPVAHTLSLNRMGVATDHVINVGTFTQGQKEFLDYHRESVLLQAHH